MGKLDFTKMHGCGNDYVYIDCFKQDVEAPELLARTLSDRHKGVGGDGVPPLLPQRPQALAPLGGESATLEAGLFRVAAVVEFAEDAPDGGLARGHPPVLEGLPDRPCPYRGLGFREDFEDLELLFPGS